MIILITEKSADFREFSDLCGQRRPGLEFFKPDCDLISSFLRTEKKAVELFIFDNNGRDIITALSPILDDLLDDYPGVLLYEEQSADEIVALLDLGIRNFFKKSRVNSSEFIAYLEGIIENRQLEDQSQEIKSGLEKKLIIEYNKTKELINSMSFGILVSTTEERGRGSIVMQCNREYLEMFHIKPESIIGRSVPDIRKAPPSPLVRDSLIADLTTLRQKDITILEMRNKTNKFIKRIITPFTDSYNIIQGYIWIFADVSMEVELGYIDPLTGLMNRRYLEDQMVREIFKVYRYGTDPCCCISLMMIDIDDFKHINDHFGHPEGDRVITEISSIILETVRNVDIAARFGGEEFMIILPCTSMEQAFQAAGRILVRVNNHKFSESYRVTISAGVSSKENIMQSLSTTSVGDFRLLVNNLIQDLIHEADHALYDAKSKGKNCVRRYPP